MTAAFDGPVEVDETYVGGKQTNMPKSKRKDLSGQDPVGKAAVGGAKDRVAAKIVESVDGKVLNEFVDGMTNPDADVYTDGSSSYKVRERHERVSHSAGEFVRYLKGVKVHTNGVESFWSMLQRAHKGVYHKLSAKHRQRYVSEFAGRHNIRELDTIQQMQHFVAGMVGRRLMYRDLTAE